MANRTAAAAERRFRWRRVDRTPFLGLNQIHLWMLTHEDMRLLVRSRGCAETLSGSEMLRAERIADRKKRRLYIGGRVGLRILLQGYTGVDNEQLMLTHGPHGKPRLQNPVGGNALDFNYTVSSGHAFYGFSMNRGLGVDLEIFPRRINFNALAGRVLSDDENRAWRNIPEDQRNDAMLCCWTRKEAYGKLLGVGIYYHLNKTNLFIDLDSDSWSTAVSGLFADEKSNQTGAVCGIQIQLPVAGAAALMYRRRSDESGRPGPEISAFMPSENFRER